MIVAALLSAVALGLVVFVVGKHFGPGGELEEEKKMSQRISDPPVFQHQPGERPVLLHSEFADSYAKLPARHMTRLFKPTDGMIQGRQDKTIGFELVLGMFLGDRLEFGDNVVRFFHLLPMIVAQISR